MEFTFHNSYVILELVPSIVIFWTEFSCWRKSYSKKATLLPDWSHRYKNSTIVITIWLTVTKYPYLKWQWILCFLRRCLYPLSLPRFYHSWLYIWVTRWVSYKKKELLTFREHTWVHPRFCFFSVLLIFFFFFFSFSSLSFRSEFHVVMSVTISA